MSQWTSGSIFLVSPKVAMRAGLIRPVDNLTSKGKVAIAVVELERFAAVNTDALPARSNRRHLAEASPHASLAVPVAPQPATAAS